MSANLTIGGFDLFEYVYPTKSRTYAIVRFYQMTISHSHSFHFHYFSNVFRNVISNMTEKERNAEKKACDRDNAKAKAIGLHEPRRRPDFKKGDHKMEIYFVVPRISDFREPESALRKQVGIDLRVKVVSVPSWSE